MPGIQEYEISLPTCELRYTITVYGIVAGLLEQQ